MAALLASGCDWAPAGEAPATKQGPAHSRLKDAPWPAMEWPRAKPEQVGLDGARLADLARRIKEGEEFPHLHSLLVVRRGYLVQEEYFDGSDADSIHTLQSVSKSFTSALIGIAIAQGKAGLDEKVLDFFPDVEKVENLDDDKKKMTLRDLLTMRSGTDYHERGDSSPHSELNRLSRGWDRFYLNRPMVREPGTRFQYDSGGVILMSAILKNRVGLHADDFAEKHLFPALGIEKTRWSANSEGHPHTGGGLHLRPRDMARFGLLHLRGGQWQGKEVVPRSWVEESTRMQVKFNLPNGHTIGYGYLWLILEPDPGGAGRERIYAAMGFRAQYIFVVPEHDLVVVVTGGTRSYADEQRPIGFLYSDILPAVLR
jgi:CubicO group peptidase (beta-lactamase class C family)